MDEKTRLKEIIEIIKASNVINDKSPENVCKLISNLGVTFIKIGQILSSRYDLLPKEYCDAFSLLRANVTPMKFSEVKHILETEYEDLPSIFSKIEEKPLGSASIAEVYRACLVTGEDVAIKVQRENIYETMCLDVKLMNIAIKTLHLNKLVKVIDLSEVLEEMFNTVKEEMDFEMEAKHLEEFRENNKEVPYLDVPKVYSKYTTKKVLVMEYIEGVSTFQKAKLQSLGYDLQEIGLNLANNFIKQAIDDGLFHADLHPDNIVIQNDKIILLDLGMMGRLSSQNRRLLKECMQAITSSDYAKVEKALLGMSTSLGEVNHQKLRQDIETILTKNAFSNLNEINIADFVSGMYKMLITNNLKLDKSITILMRGIIVIEGTLELISPEINLVTVLANKLKEDSLKEVFSKEKFVNTSRNLINGSKSLVEIPSEVLKLVTTTNQGSTKIGVEITNSEKNVDKLENLVHQVVIGLIDAALLLGASLVNDIILRNVFLGLAFVLSTWLFINMFIDHIHKGY